MLADLYTLSMDPLKKSDLFRRPASRPRRIAGAVLCLALLTAAAAHAGEDRPGALFRQGSLRLSLLFGNARAYQQDYAVYGFGAGCYVLDGLEAGIEAEFWQGAAPRIRRLSPQLTYVLPFGDAARPYAGAFYRFLFIAGRGNESDAGGRTGLLIPLGGSAGLGVGAVYERHLGCRRDIYERCSETYPELTVVFLF